MKYVPIPEAIATEARERRVDRFGHALRVVSETAPCRVCLRVPNEPEEMILLSYRPLVDTGPYAEVGPIFVHANPCAPYTQVNAFPQDFATRRLILRADTHDGRIAEALIAQPGEAPIRAEELFKRPEVAEIHVRHESYTCFDFRIVRSSFDSGATRLAQDDASAASEL